MPITKEKIYLRLKNEKPNELITYCQKTVALNEEYKTYLNQVATLPVYEKMNSDTFKILCGPQPIQEPYFLSGIKGVPSDSKYTTGSVLYILNQSQNPMDALRKSVNLGGDVDSVVSITIAIMAGRTGLNSIPKFMLERVEGKKYLEGIGNAFEEWISQF